MRLVVVTREDPDLPLARLRAKGELTELRAADLRFTSEEAADFLGRAMGLRLKPEEVAALEARTEGWIAGLQLAAVSMRGVSDISGFIASFAGSHRFVLDYLVEEVLRRESEGVQSFLVRTSILDRFCGPLCDALTGGPGATGMLEYLERVNLFVVPLDDERRWYRYSNNRNRTVPAAAAPSPGFSYLVPSFTLRKLGTCRSSGSASPPLCRGCAGASVEFSAE